MDMVDMGLLAARDMAEPILDAADDVGIPVPGLDLSQDLTKSDMRRTFPWSSAKRCPRREREGERGVQLVDEGKLNLVTLTYVCILVSDCGLLAFSVRVFC